MRLQAVTFLLLLCSCTAQFIDEMQQLEEECFGEDVFPCAGGGCIPVEQYCNGVPNCIDGSDENFCVNHTPDAGLCNDTHQFLCSDSKKCIPYLWICNLDQDCDDGSDEVNCTDTVVADDKCKGFRCDGGKCISNLWVCDGAYDCEDKSDEVNQLCRQSQLSHKIHDVSYCDRHEENYKCVDSSFCLPPSKMCDGINDCKDGSDEGPYCKNWHTMCNSHMCIGNQSVCTPDRLGPKCQCQSLYRTYNYVTHECDDIDDCLHVRPQCSQQCVNHDGSYMCKCDKGYKLDSFGYLCYAKGPEAMLFFSTKSDIKFLKIKSKQLVTVASGLKHAHGVTYDGKYLYWVETAHGHQSIVRAHLEDMEGTKEVVVGLGLEEPGDIAIDWLGGNFYFSDTARGTISACRLDGSVCTVIQTRANKPKFVTLDPRNGKMYWADWFTHGVIMSANMDGSQPEVLVEGLEGFATGLVVDVPNERLYYVDRTVRVLMLRLKTVYSLFDEPFHHPYAISVFENTVFWSDWTSNSIQSTDKLHGSRENRNIVLSENTPIFGMHMYHPAMMLATNNPCSQQHCSALCLISSNNSSVCACPVGSDLKGVSCEHKPGYHPEYLVVSAGELFTRVLYNALGNPESHATHFDVGRAQALAYDSLRDTLYFYDGQRKQINYVNMSEFTAGMPQTLLYEGFDNVVDMDYDPATDSLYVLDSGRRLVQAVSLRSRQRALVYQYKNDEVPVSLCLLPDQGRMLVAVINSESSHAMHIDSIGMDGEALFHLVMNDLKGPHIRLKYDQPSKMVYLSDEGNGIIDIIDPEGRSRKNFRQLSTTVTSLAVTDTYVFWTDRRTARLFWTDLHSTKHTVRRIDLSLFPNNTKLLLLATARPPPLPPHACLSRPCSHVCVQAPRAPHYKCLCPQGSILENGVCVEVVECKHNEFYCHRSNACIFSNKRCDGTKDCPSGEDESYCPGPTTQEDSVCSDTQFQCHNTTLCVDRRVVCDSHRDCPDNSDEHQTSCDSLACYETEFMCASGSCIMKAFKCDGDNDCSDGSDEVGCENTSCRPGYYRCRNRECIEMEKRCNGQQDCFDYSDEEDCGDEELPFYQDVQESQAEPEPHCEPFEFACPHNTSICLPSTARCNMKVECPKGTDEIGCDYHCSPHGLFACKQQHLCVTISKLCDGHNHCDDGSDETPDACLLVNRTSRLYAPLAILPAEECYHGYLCPSGQCIEWWQVCDGRPHCDQGADEGQHCALTCENHRCHHSCQRSPQGPRCLCPPGFYQAGPNLCQDIDECALDLCSHTCVNIPGSYICSCHQGYALRADRRSCKAISGNLSVLYISGNSVRSISSDGRGAVEFTDPSLATISGLDYNVRQNKLYVTSAEAGKLIEVNGTHSALVVTNIGRPTKVAVDWITGNVYFVDSTLGGGSIKVCNLAKKRCAKLLKVPNDAEVISLIVDPKNDLMFYCISRGAESMVWSASLAGRNPRDLSASCRGLAADSFSRRLYVAERGADGARIVRMDYDGLHHKTISTHAESQTPHSLALFEEHIYFLLGNSSRLARVRLAAPHSETRMYRVDAGAIVLRHPSVQRGDVTAECGGCAGVCAGRGGCVCEDGAAEGDGCAPVNKELLPLFNGWSYQEYQRAQNASISIVVAALVLLVLYIGLFLYYHFVYKPRKNRKSAYTEVRYQTNVEGSTALSYPAVDIAVDASVSHEFVNPLQYVRNICQPAFRRPKPVGTAGLNIQLPQSPPPLDCSDTESEFDDRQLIIRRK